MMTDGEIAASVPGAQKLIELFGYWPSFHDGEVTQVCLRRNRPSHLTVHAFAMTSEVTASGHYRLKNHVLVTFRLQDVRDLEFYGFSNQNVISGLVFSRVEQGLKLTLGGVLRAGGLDCSPADRSGLYAGVA